MTNALILKSPSGAATALVLAIAALPVAAAADTVLNVESVGKFLNNALFYRYHKDLGRPVQTACYFDFKVESSMGCSASTGDKGTDVFELRNNAKRHAKTACKSGGGKRCSRFSLNGRLRDDDVLGERLDEFNALLKSIGSHETEGESLPAGATFGQIVRDSFEAVKDHLETYRKDRQSSNAHYALCSNLPGLWTTFVAEGDGVQDSHVRNLCVLKCDAVASWISSQLPS